MPLGHLLKIGLLPSKHYSHVVRPAHEVNLEQLAIADTKHSRLSRFNPNPTIHLVHAPVKIEHYWQLLVPQIVVVEVDVGL